MTINVLWLGVVWWSWKNGWWYTLTVSLLWRLGLLVSRFERWAHKKVVWAFVVIVWVLTLVFNGYLTSRPVVTYNQARLSDVRLLTVPIEDFVYGLVLVGGVVLIYEKKRVRSS